MRAPRGAGPLIPRRALHVAATLFCTHVKPSAQGSCMANPGAPAKRSGGRATPLLPMPRPATDARVGPGAGQVAGRRGGITSASSLGKLTIAPLVRGRTGGGRRRLFASGASSGVACLSPPTALHLCGYLQKHPECNINEVMYNMHNRISAASGGQAEVSIVRWLSAPVWGSSTLAEGTAVAIKNLQLLQGGRSRFRPPETQEEFAQARKPGGKAGRQPQQRMCRPSVGGSCHTWAVVCLCRGAAGAHPGPMHALRTFEPACPCASDLRTLPAACLTCRCIRRKGAAHRAAHTQHPAQQRLRRPRDQAPGNCALAGKVVG